MKTIRVYGDSFCSPNDTFKCWPSILGENLKLPVVNKAISGSSTEYSIKCLVSDFVDKSIKENDIVIFVTSTPGRLTFSYQNNQKPETASIYLHVPTEKTKSKYDEWYTSNKNHIEWTMFHQDIKLLQLNHEAYLNLIKNIARELPTSTFLILANSDHHYHILDSHAPPNFLQSKTYLNTISGNEFKDNLSYPDWIKLSGIDYRINHFTVQNLNILAQLVEQSINERTVENITYDKFRQHVLKPITSKNQYLEYVENGYLYDMFSLRWFAKIVPPLK